MEMYSQIQYQNEQMMLYQAMQMQQQAYLYNSYMQQQQMPSVNDNSDRKKNKRSYVQCDLWKRQALIEKVDKEGMTIKDAAKYLDVNYSTAKHIMKVYRQTGEVETKIMMKRKNRDSKQSVDNEDADMELDQQCSTNVDSHVQSYAYDSNYGQCQLPVDENMIDSSFVPEAMSDEEKERVHMFIFGAQPSCQ